MKTFISLFIINLLEIVNGLHETIHYGRRSMQGSLIPLQGPIYLPAETILAAASIILGQQQQSPMINFLDEFKPSTLQNLPQQVVYEEAYDTVNQRPVQVRRRSNTNTQQGIQQIGYGNMNLQGNIQQIYRRRSAEENGRRYGIWDSLRGRNIENLDVHQVYNIVDDEIDNGVESTGVDIGSDFNVENVNLYQDFNILSDDSF